MAIPTQCYDLDSFGGGNETMFEPLLAVDLGLCSTKA